MTPQQLVTAAQNGDRDAFAELWRMYRPQISGAIYRRTSDRSLTEDLTSETFLRAWKRLPDFTWQGKGFGGWVATIALNLVADHYKAASRRNAGYYPINDAEDWPLPSSDRRDNPEQAVEHADLAQALDEAIAQLTPDQRHVIHLRYGRRGLSFADIAGEMGRRPLAARSVHWRALRSLETDERLAALAVAA